MRLSFLFTFFVCLLLSLLGCKKKVKPQSARLQPIYSTGTGELIPIDLNDSNYYGVDGYALDTATSNGWLIKYFVKDDSTKYSDIYIEWSKGTTKGIYKGTSVLQFRRAFIPRYIGENSKCLFFLHQCASECRTLTTFRKDSAVTMSYTNVVDYSLPLGQIVCVTDEGQEDFRPFQLAVVDLFSDKEQLIQFKNFCMYATSKEQCVDTVIFAKDKVLVKAILTEANDDKSKEVVEQRTVTIH